MRAGAIPRRHPVGRKLLGRTPHVLDTNAPPVCALAQPNLASLWPPNHKLVAITLSGVADPDDDEVILTILGVTQDEPVNGLGDGDTSPDAVVQDQGVLLRAERGGTGDGRVYRVAFEADEDYGSPLAGRVRSGIRPRVKPDPAADTLGETPEKPEALSAEGAKHALAYIGCADTPMLDLGRLFWLGDAREAIITRGEALESHGVDDGIELRVPDARASRRHARIVLGVDGWSAVDSRSTNGTYVNGRRVARQLLKPGDILETGHSFWRFLEVRPKAAPPLEASFEMGPTRTICPELCEQLSRLRLVAAGKLQLLILGETGAGKEVVARQVHAWSGRRGPFGAMSCADLPGSMIERELFGHLKGAFTDAIEDRPGRIEAADRGSLLLDEIGDLQEEAQVKLLRVVQDGEVTRIGDTRPRRVDVRFIAATHRDLPEFVRAGRFREDLYGRLKGLTMRIPPLRDRAEDIGILVAYFLRKFGAPPGVRIEVELMRWLLSHPWRFNVRDLEHVIESALLQAKSSARLGLRHVEPELREPDGGGPRVVALRESDAQVRDRLSALLEEHAWNISSVARAMGKSRWQVHRWIRRLGIRPAKQLE